MKHFDFLGSRLLPLSLAAAVSLFSLTACSSGNNPGPSTGRETVPVTLSEVAHSIFYAPQYAAIELGYFAEEGIDLELVTGFGVGKIV